MNTINALISFDVFAILFFSVCNLIESIIDSI